MLGTIVAALSLLGVAVSAQIGEAASSVSATMPSVHPLLVTPFALMLLSIAMLPLVREHWWEHNTNKALVAGLLGLPIAVYYAAQGEAGWSSVEHALIEYVEFIILLGSLYIISGGIVLRGDLRATPLVNTAFLGFGALLASFMGTTGASMLLIRPVLQTNSERHHVVHTIVFFIFLVSNLGGCLTPLGDPPLFLGYLRGVPFTCSRDLSIDRTHLEPLRLRGAVNFLWLALVILAVALAPPPWRACLMLAATLGSLYYGDPVLRVLNKFTYYPIIEVAVLFIGIFLTMIPALQLLRLHGHHLGVDTAAKFFWATGLLSSFLDNAPTYVAFFEAAKVQVPATFSGPTVVGIPSAWLEAVSLGAVFMGANTYIGNGPNFMVKAVAEEAGVNMPSFFGYMRYSCLILWPLFGLLTFLVF